VSTSCKKRRLSALADQVDELTCAHASRKNAFAQLEQKYSALLTLYGEKVEIVEELQLDLSDVKQLLRQQTEEWANQNALL